MGTENTLRFLKVDYQSHKDALLQRIRSRYPRVWNDFLTNNIGIVLVDVIAWSTATLAFIANRQAGENFTPTMTLRESAVNLGAFTGYQLRGPTPAVVSCDATLSVALESGSDNDVTISKGTVIRTSDKNSLPFEVAQDYTIPGGETTATTPVVTLSAALTGSNVLSTYISVTAGSSNADLTDSTINLKDYIQAGQTFSEIDSATAYLVQDVQSAPGAVSNNRIVLSTPWTGDTGIIAAEVYDQRIQLLQGQTVSDRFVTPAITSPSYAVKLSTTPVIDGSVKVEFNGEAWTQVKNFATSDADSEVFQVKTFSTGVTAVIFGDGIFGKAVPTEAVISIVYRIGGGVSGNVDTGSINTSISGTERSTSNPIVINISNATSPGQGGRDAESLEEARVNIPAYTRTNDRGVTLDDYQTLAQQFSSPLGSVAYARAAIRTENALLEGNVVVIYAWTTGNSGALAPLSAQLKQALKDYVQTKAVGTDYVTILDGSDRPLPISLRFKSYGGFSITDTKPLVQDTLNSFVDILRPGQSVVISNLMRKLDEVFGVDSVEIATPTSDLSPSNSTELFTRPKEDYVYALARNGSGTPVESDVDSANINLYVAHMPVFPLEAWSFRLFLGAKEIVISPGIEPGFAQLYGENLSVNEDQDSEKNYLYASTVNLLTGRIELWIKGAPGDLTMKLRPVQGYSSERTVNIFVGYSGDNSQTKRREIRSALRAWGRGLSIGGAIYADEIAGVTASKSSITAVVNAILGVTGVNRVALDTPANTDERINALDSELLRIGNIVLNNSVDLIVGLLIPVATIVAMTWKSSMFMS